MKIYTDHPKYAEVLQLSQQGRARNVRKGGRDYTVINHVKMYQGEEWWKPLGLTLLKTIATVGIAFCFYEDLDSDWKAIFSGRKVYEVYTLKDHPKPVANPPSRPSYISASPVPINLNNDQLLLKKLIENPHSLLTPDRAISTHNPAHICDFKEDRDIFECHCVPELSRPKQAEYDARRILEENLIQKIQQKFPLSTHPKLNLCSFAAGGCFQELVLHAKLVKLGYKVDWFIVDPRYFGNYVNTVKAFAELTHRLSPGTQVTRVFDFEQFFASQRELPAMNVILSIDTEFSGLFVPVDRQVWQSKPTANRIPYAQLKTGFISALTKCFELMEESAQYPLLVCYMDKEPNVINQCIRFRMLDYAGGGLRAQISDTIIQAV